MCLYQNSSTLQNIHRVPSNLEKKNAVKETQNYEVELQTKEEKYITLFPSSILTNRSRVWLVNFLIINSKCLKKACKRKLMQIFFFLSREKE